jgi:hypothetical protein
MAARDAVTRTMRAPAATGGLGGPADTDGIGHAHGGRGGNGGVGYQNTGGNGVLDGVGDSGGDGGTGGADATGGDPPWALPAGMAGLHYFASVLIASGDDIKTVQARMRHATARTTLDAYGHLWPDADESTRSAIGIVIMERMDSIDSAADELRTK